MLLPFVLVGDVVSVYIVGSCRFGPPAVLTCSALGKVIASDLDLLLFVRPDASFDFLTRIVSNIQGICRLNWGSYSSLRVGIRVRPISRVALTLTEYLHWGENLRGHCQPFLGHNPIRDCDTTLRRVPADVMLRNILSKATLTLGLFPLVKRSVSDKDRSRDIPIQRQIYLARAVRKMATLLGLATWPDKAPSAAKARDDGWLDLAQNEWGDASLRDGVGRLAYPQLPLQVPTEDEEMQAMEVVSAAIARLLTACGFRLSRNRAGYYRRADSSPSHELLEDVDQVIARVNFLIGEELTYAGGNSVDMFRHRGQGIASTSIEPNLDLPPVISEPSSGAREWRARFVLRFGRNLLSYSETACLGYLGTFLTAEGEVG